MRTTAISLNPFSLMMEPEVVLQAMERSRSLRSLRRHKLRPLDKPLIPFADGHLVSDDAELFADSDSALAGLDE
jgi:hypothetical protein